MSSPVRQDLTGCTLHDRQKICRQRTADASDVPVFLTGFQPGFVRLFRRLALPESVSPGLHRNAGGTR